MTRALVLVVLAACAGGQPAPPSATSAPAAPTVAPRPAGESAASPEETLDAGVAWGVHDAPAASRERDEEDASTDVVGSVVSADAGRRWTPPVVRQPADLAAARALFQQGVARYDAGDYATAEAKFEHAYALGNGSSRVLYNIAQCLAQLGRSADAADAFDQYLARTPDVPAARRQEVLERIRRLRQRAGAP